MAHHRHDHRHGHEGTMHAPGAYDAHDAPLAFGDEARTRERILDAASVAAGDRVLDVGCGTGTLALAAARRIGARGLVVGIDASPEMVVFARAKAQRESAAASFARAPADALPFPDARFDAVLCSLALHHLTGDARTRAIAEVRRVLAPGGRVLVVEFGWPMSTVDWLRALLRPRSLLHARRAPPFLDAAAAALRDGGFCGVTMGSLRVSSLGYALARR